MTERNDLFDLSGEKPENPEKGPSTVDHSATTEPLERQGTAKPPVPAVVPLRVSKVRDRKAAARFVTRRGGVAAVKLFRDLAAVELKKPVSLAMAEAISTTTGLPLHDVLKCKNGDEIHAKVIAWRAMLGHIPSFQEIHDRLDPKVSKIEATVTPRPMTPQGNDETENAAAADFFELLES